MITLSTTFTLMLATTRGQHRLSVSWVLHPKGRLSAKSSQICFQICLCNNYGMLQIHIVFIPRSRKTDTWAMIMFWLIFPLKWSSNHSFKCIIQTELKMCCKSSAIELISAIVNRGRGLVKTQGLWHSLVWTERSASAFKTVEIQILTNIM